MSLRRLPPVERNADTKGDKSHKLVTLPIKLLGVGMKKLIFAVTILFLVGCRASQRAELFSLGSDQKVTLYSYDGRVIREWTSNGKVSTENGSDGWHFQDKATGKSIRVSGIVVIE